MSGGLAVRPSVSEREIGSGREWPVSDARGSARAVDPLDAVGAIRGGNPLDAVGSARVAGAADGSDPGAPVDFLGLLLLLAGIGVPAPGSEGPPGDERSSGDVPAPETAAATPSPASLGGLDPATVQLAAQASPFPPAAIPQALVHTPVAPQPETAAPRTAAPAAPRSAPPKTDAIGRGRRNDAIALDGVHADVEPETMDPLALTPRVATAPDSREVPTASDAPAPSLPATPASAELRADVPTAASATIDMVRLAPAHPTTEATVALEMERPAPAAEANQPARRDRAAGAARRLSAVERSAGAEAAPAPDALRHAAAPTRRGADLTLGGHDATGGDRSGARGDDADRATDAASGTTRSATRGAVPLRADGDVSAFAHLADAPRPATAVTATPQVAEIAPARAVIQTPVADQVVQVARLVIAEGHTRMEVTLDPPALGAVRVTADAAPGGIQLTIAAEQPETRALLLSAVPEMQAALASRGVVAVAVAVAGGFDQPDGRRAPARREFQGSSRFQDTNTDRRRERPARTRRVSALDFTV